nr:MAG TPA: hypothetical protein [Microviridae sp.]
MLHKTWNARDETDDMLVKLLEKKYKSIEAEFNLLRKVSTESDAHKLVSEIWAAKNFANSIELELMRRGFYNGTAS